MNEHDRKFDIFNALPTIFENVRTTVIVIDANKNIVYANPFFCSLVDLSEKDIIGKNVIEFDIEPKEEVNKKLNEILHNSLSDTNFKFEFKVKNTQYFVGATASLLCCPNKIQYILILIHDLTYEIQMINNLQESHRIIEQANNTLKSISRVLEHDMNNNLIAISGYLNEFLETNNKRMLEKAQIAIEKGFNLINDMRVLSESLETPTNLKLVNLEEVANKIITANLAQDVNISYSGSAKVEADEFITSILMNIVQNAIKHGNATNIKIKIENNNSEKVIVDIIDNGRGIPDSIKGYIFKYGFSYGDNKGSGLGLAIVKKVMEKYGGTVTVRDNNPKGTIFTLTFPKIKGDKKK